MPDAVFHVSFCLCVIGIFCEEVCFLFTVKMVNGFLSKSLLALGLYSSLVAGKDATPPYKDARVPVEDRVSDLLGRMTIEDKMAQLIQGALYFQRSRDCMRTKEKRKSTDSVSSVPLQAISQIG